MRHGGSARDEELGEPKGMTILCNLFLGPELWTQEFGSRIEALNPKPEALNRAGLQQYILGGPAMIENSVSLVVQGPSFTQSRFKFLLDAKDHPRTPNKPKSYGLTRPYLNFILRI